MSGMNQLIPITAKYFIDKIKSKLISYNLNKIIYTIKNQRISHHHLFHQKSISHHIFPCPTQNHPYICIFGLLQPKTKIKRHLIPIDNYNINFQQQMSQSPERLQLQLENQIDKRILKDSPNKQDVDYYRRKIARLENQYNLLSDELSKTKIKMRRAQDFQIKYDLLTKQNSNFNLDIEKKQKDICQLKTKNQYLKSKLEEKENKGEDWSVERKNLQEEIDKWKNKCEEVEDKRTNDIAQLKQKSDDMIKREHDLVKRQFAEKEENYQFQIKQLRKTLHQKQTVQSIINNKVNKIREEKDQQINRLAKIIEKQKADHTAAIDQKNQEFDKMRDKFEKMLNFQLQNIKKNQQDQNQLFNIQLNGLRQIIGLKNQQINKVYDQSKQLTQSHETQRQELLSEIQLLKDKIYTVQRQNQMELLNLKERLTKIQSVQIEAIQKRFNDLIKTLKLDKDELQKLIKQKDRQIEGQRRQLQRVKQQLLDRIKQRQTRILQLQQRLKDVGDVNANQMRNLHSSFHKIQTQKQIMVNQYQTNVGFLNQQIAKLTSNNQLKNNEIKKLHEEIVEIKAHFTETIKDLESRWKQERKEREEEKQEERTRRQNMEEQFRVKQRDWKLRERQLEREKQKQQRENSKLKYICEQLEKDIERLNQYIKQIDQNLKKQFKKNQVSTLDTDGIRRQLTAELERQKNQLEALKRMEVDQIKKKSQIEINRLTSQNQKLQTELLNKSIAYQNLEGQFKKLQHINKNIDRINKEKLIDYQKKMATLNNEINITQNLYQSFIQAKCRSGKKPNS